MPSTKPTALGGGGASARGGKTRRCARKSSVNTPTTAATALPDKTPKSNVPTTVPIRPAGSSRRSSSRSRCRHNCWMLVKSITSSSGNMIAAACGTGTASAIIGVASAPKPIRKPLFDKPINNTAGIAAA